LTDSHHLRIGVDVGGTFTDCIAVDLRTGAVKSSKVPTTPGDQSEGFIASIESADLAVHDALLILHGCTVGLNAVLTRSGAKIGIITTTGFRDVTAMGRGHRPGAHQFDPEWRRSFGDVLRPLVPRYLRRTVTERINGSGEVVFALNEDDVRREADFLAFHQVEAISVCFVNSYANDSHEKQAKDLITTLHPNIPVITSTEVHACFKEYPRFSTCTVNAYVAPLMDRYLKTAENRLRSKGYAGSLFVMQSNGGVVPSATARTRPATTLQSGPTGGVVAAQYLTEQLGIGDLLTLDVGGTTADTTVVINGQPAVTTELEVEHDLLVALPAVNVHSIGAGGGSIAWIDHLGALRVGPHGAGAIPGPACYGRGGTEPTVTDALVVLGVLRPELVQGAHITLDAGLARTAIQGLAERLGMTVEEAALGVFDLATANMVEAAREVSLHNGVDPRQLTLVAFGAAGPMFGSRIGRDLGTASVLIPPHPGEMCAYGLAIASLRFDVSEPLVAHLDSLGPDRLDETYSRIESRANAVLEEQGISLDQITMLRYLDGRYDGQTWETPSVPVPSGRLDGPALTRINTSFHEAHRALWGYAIEHGRVFGTMARVSAVASLPGVKPELGGNTTSGGDLVDINKDLYLGEWMEARIVDRRSLQTGTAVRGPAVVIQPTATTLLMPGDEAHVDEAGNLRIDTGSGSEPLGA